MEKWLLEEWMWEKQETPAGGQVKHMVTRLRVVAMDRDRSGWI